MQRKLSFRDLGLSQPLKLGGVSSEVSLAFGVRLDETVVAASLDLNMSVSPALLARLSHVNVRLNGEMLKTIPIDGSSTQLEIRNTISVDPRLFTDYNQLSLQLIGHYTLECEDATHSSLWVQFGLDSGLDLRLLPLEIRAGLSALPAPFFDQRDNSRLQLPMVFGDKPTPNMIESAGIVASWFGKLADYRGARFPVRIDQWPERHGLMLLTNDTIPESLDVKPTDRPRVFILQQPKQPHRRVLVFHGKNEAQLRQAVIGTVYGHTLMNGQSAIIESVVEPPARALYDVPKWIRTDRKVSFDELVENPLDLQVKGHQPLPIKINARIPPDLYTGFERVIDLDLKYRYTKPIDRDNSSLAVFINQRFVQSFRLESETQVKDEFQLRLPILNAERFQRQSDVEIPAFQIDSDNQMQFQFSLDYHNSDRCKDTPTDDVHAAIDPDSSIDLTGFSHYVDMPNLALFANAGYPFTRYADLSGTTIVLPDAYSAADIEASLFVLGRMARMTGVVATRFDVTTVSKLQDIERDLLLIGVDAKAGTDSESESLILNRSRKILRAQRSPQAANAAVKLSVLSSAPIGGVLGYESPLAKGRSVVALVGSNADSLLAVTNVLDDPGRVHLIRGTAAVIADDAVHVVDNGTSYSLGNLSWRDRLWIFLARHPWILSALGVITAMLLALVCFLALRMVSSARLKM
ncbi:MAG: cellulose biosynthesis cyclic di-GMP-binding regulatory protein BcsB [Oceanococcus sp.]